MSANTFRYRSGDTKSVELQTCPQVNGVQPYPIQEGDLVGLVTVVYSGVTYYQCAVPAGALRNASDGYTSLTPDGGSAITGTNPVWVTAAAFYKAFAGVALNKRGTQAGETVWKLQASIDPGYISVATAGRFEYTCTGSTVWQTSDLVKVGVSAGNTLPQTVDKSDKLSIDYIGVAYPTYPQLNAQAGAAVGQTNPTTPTILFELRTQTAHQQIASGT